MNDPIYILFRHTLDDDIYLEYMEDPREYWSIRRACSSAYERLTAELDPDLKHRFDAFMDERVSADTIEVEAAFTTGLSFGLRLLRLL